MGYTTEFTGALDLSRKLTMAEAKELLEIASGDDAQATTGIDAYFQWVPATTLQHIVWDGEEKFYKYVEQLEWLCGWLQQRDIAVSGCIYWRGEETSDTGVISVAGNSVLALPDDKPKNKKDPTPLTLRGLQEMALNQVTSP